MASDVTLQILWGLIILLTVALTCGKDMLVARPIFLDENLYFELVEPEDISYTYKIRPAKDFGSAMNTTYFNVRLVPTVPLHGCSPVTNTLYVKDAIAFMERGGCSFLTKSIHAEQAGAIAVIIMDYDVENDHKMIDMIQDETGRSTSLASFFMLGKDGYMIRQTLQDLQLDNAVINIPYNSSGMHLKKVSQPPWTLW